MTASTQRYPGRNIQVADADCSCPDTYHSHGVLDCVADVADKYALKGYTHYLRGNDDEWVF